MKISQITIVLEASDKEKEDGKQTRVLIRLDNKMWAARYQTSTDYDTAMYPHEMRLITSINELVIKSFNATGD